MNIFLKTPITLAAISSASHIVAAPTETLQTAKISKPNIVYILADDMGYGDISILNKRDQKILTPNIDRIGKEGIIFTDAHSGSAVCTPTRYGVITGRYAWRTRLKRGVLNGLSPHLIEEKRVTVPSFLKQNGYDTAMFGKWHLGMDFKFKDNQRSLKSIEWSVPIKFSPIAYGFDYFFGISASLDMPPYIYIENNKFLGECSEPAVKIPHFRSGKMAPGFHPEKVLPDITDKCVDYIKKQSKKDKPFFIYMALTAPHTPVVPTKQFKGKSELGTYGDFCLEVDWCVGRILDAIDSANLVENTIVIFTSDNGCAPYIGVKQLEDKGHYPSYIYRGYKADIFEGGHRVPFLLRWPAEVKAGSRSSDTICLTDLFATCADILRKPVPTNAGEDSLSILPAMLGKKIAINSRKAIVNHSINGSFALRQGKWKLVMCPGSGGWGDPIPSKAKKMKLPPIQLYNLEEDPAETKNLYKEYPETVEKMKKLLKEYKLNDRSVSGNIR